MTLESDAPEVDKRRFCQELLTMRMIFQRLNRMQDIKEEQDSMDHVSL